MGMKQTSNQVRKSRKDADKSANKRATKNADKFAENLAKDFTSVSSASLDPVKAIENDREFKAHIYQQLVDLQPYLEPESQISVLVQIEQDLDEVTESGTTIALTLVASIQDYKIEAEGRSADMYEAFGFAKQGMLVELEEFHNASVDTNARNAEIQTLLTGGYTIH
jgi:ribosome-associated translation inhibitor RaiA